jgi:putative hemolysin
MDRSRIYALLYTVILLSIVISIAGCGAQAPLASTGNTTNLSETPAYHKCVSDGGQEKLLYGPDGQYAICLFSDGSVCDEKEYFLGTCTKGACNRTCQAIGSRSEGWYDCNGKLLFWDQCANETAATAGTC